MVTLIIFNKNLLETNVCYVAYAQALKPLNIYRSACMCKRVINIMQQGVVVCCFTRIACMYMHVDGRCGFWSVVVTVVATALHCKSVGPLVSSSSNCKKLPLAKCTN